MGYTTKFDGRFDLNKKLSPEMREFLVRWNHTRHIQYDVDKLKAADKYWKTRTWKNGELGPEGLYYAPGSILDMMDGVRDCAKNDNLPPVDAPSLWCQWMPCDDGWGIEWDRDKDFHDYLEWLEFLIKHFLAPDGYVLNGSVQYQGEDSSDQGWLIVSDNKIIVREVSPMY